MAYRKITDPDKIQAGRDAADAYREAHRRLHEKGWHKGIANEHTPLLEALVEALSQHGFTSPENGFEKRKAQVLARFWDCSDEKNVKELGFADKADFKNRAQKTDSDALENKWR